MIYDDREQRTVQAGQVEVVRVHTFPRPGWGWVGGAALGQRKRKI